MLNLVKIVAAPAQLAPPVFFRQISALNPWDIAPDETLLNAPSVSLAPISMPEDVSKPVIDTRESTLEVLVSVPLKLQVDPPLDRSRLPACLTDELEATFGVMAWSVLGSPIPENSVRG